MPLRSGNLKIILALLIEVIAFHLRVAIVKIGVLGLEKSIGVISSFDRNRWSYRSLVLDLLDTNPHELLEKVIIWQSWQSSRSGRRGFRA